MLDILLNDGDLVVTDTGDIRLTNSVRQAITIRLLWFAREWRFNTSYGIPYYDEVYVKRPNLDKIKLIFASEIRKVEEVLEVENLQLIVDAQSRIAGLTFTVYTSREIFDMEVGLGA